MSDRLSTVQCLRHVASVQRFARPNYDQAVAWHAFMVEHAKCQLFIVPEHRERGGMVRRAA